MYAIAMSDGNIQENEIYTLHDSVLKDLAINEQSADSSGMNQAFYVDFEFDESIKRKPDLNEILKSYVHFIKMNSEPVDRDLMSRSLQLLEDVSNAYTDEKEKDIISRISKEMRDSLKYIVN